jgi:hypothetical protein
MVNQLPHPITPHYLLLINIRRNVGLSGGLCVRVVPKAVTPKSTTQGRQSLLPSPQARGPTARLHPRGV